MLNLITTHVTWWGKSFNFICFRVLLAIFELELVDWLPWINIYIILFTLNWVYKSILLELMSNNI